MVIDVMSPYSLDCWSKKCDFYELSLFDNASMYFFIPNGCWHKKCQVMPKKSKKKTQSKCHPDQCCWAFLVKCEVFSWKIFLKVYQTNKTSFEHKILILIHLWLHDRFLESLLFKGLLQVKKYLILLSLLISFLLKCLVKLSR